MARTLPTNEWTEFLVLKKKPLSDLQNPQTIPPCGMNKHKQHNLYKVMRQYAPQNYKDILCPVPDSQVIDNIKKIKSAKV